MILYDRSAESYLVDPYEYGPWTSQNHGPAGDRPLDLPDLLRLGRRYLAEQVDGVVLRDQLARPSLRDRILGRTLAAFQTRLSAKITLVDDQGALVDA